MVQQTGHQPDPFLLEIPAYVPNVGVTTLRYATHSLTTAPSDTPANTFYDGRLKDPGTFKRSVWENGATSGKATIDFGFADLINADGALDPLISYGWTRVATMKQLLARDAPVAGAVTVIKPTVLGIETPDAFKTLRLRYRGRMVELDQPLLTRRYLGTTTSGDAAVQTEGDETYTGQIVPYAFGPNTSVPGKLVSKFYNLFQFAANAQSSILPKDGGIDITVAGDFASPASLLNATITPGTAATCLAQGMVRFGATPSFTVTANLIEGATLSVRSAARVMQRMLALCPTISGSDIETATFDALHTFNDAEVGIYIDDDKSGIDLISAVADSIGGALIETTSGTYRAIYNGGPAASSSATFTLRELLDGSTLQAFAGPSREGQGVPAYSVIVNYGRVWKTMGSGDLAPRIAEADSGDDLALKTLLAQQNRTATASDASVQTVYPQAVQLTFDTLLTDPTEAAAEAARRLALYKVRRDSFLFPTFFDDGNIELGATVKVQMSRFGLAGGKNFLVTGREDNYKDRRRVLTLWG